MSKITIDERVFEIVQWERHLTRYLIHNLHENVKGAVQMGLADQQLLDIVDDLIKEKDDKFLQLRTKSFEELREARHNGFKFKDKEVSDEG